MRKRTQKICAVLLSGCMVMSLGACGVSKGGDTAISKDTGTEKAASGEDLKTIKVGLSRDTSFKYQGDETAENNTWTNLYRENGIQLDVMYEVDISQATEKLAQCVMSGDYPDFMSVDAKNFQEWAQQGVFADLTEGLEKYASDEIKEYYQTEAGKRALQAATIDGKIYGLPVVASPNDSMPMLLLRQDWLENLGLEIPKTVDEFYEVAKAFSENDPDQNGEDDTYGFAVNGKDVFQNFGDLGTYFEMFGAQPGHITNNGNMIPFIDVDGQAVYGGSKTEEMKQGLELLQKMYEEKIISPDFVTAGQDQIIQDLSAGKVGMAFNIFYGAEMPWKNAVATQPDANFVFAAIPGLTEELTGQAFYTAAPTTFNVMSSKYEDMETFFKILNLGTHYCGRPDNVTQEEYEMYNGLPGKYTGYTLSVGGLPMASKNMAAYDKLQNAMKTGDTSELNPENLRDYNAMMKYVDNKDRRDELNEEELAAYDAGILYWSVWGNENCAYQVLHEMEDKGNYMYSAYDAAATQKMNECTTSLVTLTKETLIDIITGNKDVDYYDEFLEQWNEMGGAEITEEANTWYQETK
ncbi:MAG: extracellular solute-binding protein [Bacillota bacterium]|nr:extracellular solute-binding protein [Bacillota bacterium]